MMCFYLVRIDPIPSISSTGEDYFGNPVHYLTVQEPHNRLVVEAHSRVEVDTPTKGPEVSASPAWERIREGVQDVTGAGLAAFEFCFDSPYVATSDEIYNYAAVSLSPGRPILEAVSDLTARIYHEFEYRGGVSDVSTPVRDVLAMRKGVCQDFAHLQIACLRSFGLPARYVSGYLLTHPPEGKEKLVGADASHAWVSVWSGSSGWIDFDPTNNVLPSTGHVTIGWGRDYGDVSPINGFILGGGTHQVVVAVDVNPVTPPRLR